MRANQGWSFRKPQEIEKVEMPDEINEAIQNALMPRPFEETNLDTSSNVASLDIPSSLMSFQRQQRAPAKSADSMPAPEERMQTQMNPQVKEYLTKKLDLGEYSGENRAKLAESSGPGGYDALGSMLAAVSAGMTGRDAAGAASGVLDRANKRSEQSLKQFDAGKANKIQDYSLERESGENQKKDELSARESDPNSQESAMAQELAKKMGFKGDSSVITAAQFKQFSPSLSKIYEIEQKKLDRQDMMGLKREALDLKRGGPGGTRLTEGQKAVDKDFAKDYNDWTSGASSAARTEIDKLKTVAAQLRSGKVSLGRENAMVPDIMADRSRLAARADVESSVMSSLRSILGAAFTQEEGRRVINTTWNENDSEENNLKRIERLAGDLDSKAAAKDAKASHYEQYGSLNGYKSEGAQTRSEPSVVERKTKDGRVALFDANTKQFMGYK